MFYLPMDAIPKGSYEIYEVPDGTLPGEHIKLNPQDVIYINEGSLADDWVSVGIAGNMLQHDKIPGIVCNPDDLDELNGLADEEGE